MFSFIDTHANALNGLLQ